MRVVKCPRNLMQMAGKLVSNDKKILIQQEIAKKNSAENRGFSAVVAVPPPFLHSSVLLSIQATVMPNAVTHTLAEFHE